MRNPGDRQRILCPLCGADTQVVFEIRPYVHDGIDVTDFLVGRCSACHDIAVVPSEGIAALLRAIRAHEE